MLLDFIVVVKKISTISTGCSGCGSSLGRACRSIGSSNGASTVAQIPSVVALDVDEETTGRSNRIDAVECVDAVSKHVGGRNRESFCIFMFLLIGIIIFSRVQEDSTEGACCNERT